MTKEQFIFGLKKEAQERKELIGMDNITELAHKLTERDCERMEIIMDNVSESEEVTYTTEAQIIFDEYYDLITNTLNI